MIGDADDVGRGTCIAADICVVGSGAAGISLALALSGRGLSVIMLESGRARGDRRTQALYRGEVANQALHSPPDRYRLRRFGGSTVIWGGRCVPFDPIDFEAREYLPVSGWPIPYSDLAPFYPSANDLSEAGQYEYSADSISDWKSHPMIPGFASEVVSTSSLERFSCPTDFAARYGRRLRRLTDLRIFLGANCTAIRLGSNARQVKALEVAGLGGNRFLVSARSYVLAAGGLETARLLLASRDVNPAGVGNEHDVVGRYYMCHIAGSVGELTLRGPTRLVRHGYEIAPEGVYCRRRLTVAPAQQRRLQLLNLAARLHIPRIADPGHRNGVLSGLFLVRKAIRYEYGKRLDDGRDTSIQDYLRHIRNVLLDPVDTSVFLSNWITKRTLAERKFPSVILRNKTNRFSLEINAEQTPQANSRVSLNADADELGMPRLTVDWRYCASDIESVRRSLEQFRNEIRRCRVGELRFDAETLEADLTRFGAYGGHHIGTARMGRDVRTSVVDSDCKVHSVGNLYIAGSAVFPTSSQANPTLTIVALALRLAEHLCRRLNAPGSAAAVVRN